MEMAGFEFKQHLHPHAGTHTPLYLSALAHSDARKLQFTLWMQVHSNGHSHTSAHLRTHSPGLDVPDGGRRCCFSMNRLQFFAEGSGSTYTYARTHVCASTHAHGVNARRRSLWVNVSAAIPAVAALIIFIYAFSNTEGERERERWERLRSNYCYVFTRRHPAGLVTPRFLVQIPSRICLFVVDAYAHQRITSIKSSAYILFVCPCILFVFGFFCSLLLKRQEDIGLCLRLRNGVCVCIISAQWPENNDRIWVSE